MNSLFNAEDATAILVRMAKLNPDLRPMWGKMTVSQMLAHCQVPLEIALGRKKLKRTFIGLLFGAMAARQFTRNEKPFKKDLPTDPHFVVADERDFITEFQKLEKYIQDFAESDHSAVAKTTHPFFGRMAPEQWGILAWKHLDHHLRQFGV